MSFLRKVVQFQIENALLAGIDFTEAKKQQTHRYELQTMRVIERNPEKLIASFIMLFRPGSGSAYELPVTLKTLRRIRIQMQLSLEGIVAALNSENGFTVIEELMPGGGAERSGLLKPKDKIIAVAQEGEKPIDVIYMDLQKNYQDDPRQERHTGNFDNPYGRKRTHRPLRRYNNARQDRPQGAGGQDKSMKSRNWQR